MSIVVLGSINMDLVVRPARLPKTGETLFGRSFSTIPGGKGANQSVACARLGAPTALIGKVGDDVFGATLRDSLKGYGVDVTHVATQAGQSSGVALITVDDAAENTIIVVSGANATVGGDSLKRLDTVLRPGDILLLQFEVPLETVTEAARIARAKQATVILDPAPARTVPAELYTLVDIITPNEVEAETLVGFPVADEAAAAKAGSVLLDHGVQNAVIKMGARGAYWTKTGSSQFFPAFKVQAVDTVAAGDAFNGGLAVALSEGLALDQALLWGVAVGAISVTRPGAQPSMPTRDEVVAMLDQKG